MAIAGPASGEALAPSPSSGLSASPAAVVAALAAGGKNDDELGYMGEEGVSTGKEEEPDEAELEHFASVRQAFELYEHDALLEVHRIERHLRRLAPEDRALLKESIGSRIARLKDAIACNQAFINLVLIASDNSNMQPHGTFPSDSLDGDRGRPQACAESHSHNTPAVARDEGCYGCDCHHPSAGCVTTEPTEDAHRGQLAQKLADVGARGLREPSARHPPGGGDQATAANGSYAGLPPPEPELGGGRAAAGESVKKKKKKKKSNGKSPAGCAKPRQPDQDQKTHSGGPADARGSGFAAGDGLPCSAPPSQGHCGESSAPSDSYRMAIDHEKLARNMSKVRSTLRQFVRDWSAEGAEEREAAYGPLLEALESRMPIRDRTKPPRVLCPGSGLGRLPFEVTRRGYACQGNEFSYFMLMGSDFILNHALKVRSCPLQPYCLSTSNRRGRHDHLQTVWIPDVSPNEHISPDTDFSMCAGEFVEVYGGCDGTPSGIPGASQPFDAVLTSYFLDTARNVLLYIRTIAKILPPGGLWANIGPLLYHYAEMPNEMSIELAWDELEEVIRLWFDIEKIEWRDAYYTSNPKSMMQVQYHCVFFVAIRNSAPAPVVTPLPDAY